VPLCFPKVGSLCVCVCVILCGLLVSLLYPECQYSRTPSPPPPPPPPLPPPPAGVGFAVLTDCEDLVSHFVNNTEIRSALSKNQKFVESMHFTDQNTKSTNHKKLLRFVFSLPTGGDEMSAHRTLLSMSFFLIDYVGNTHLKQSSRVGVWFCIGVGLCCVCFSLSLSLSLYLFRVLRSC
jgi:PAT complex subunit CCDC47